MVMDFVKKNILNVYMPVIYFYAYCFFAFELPQIFYIDLQAALTGDHHHDWFNYPQFEGSQSGMTHTQALIHIIVGSILFTSSTYDLLYDKKRQLLSGFLTGFLIIATYNFTNVMQIIAATGFFLALMTLYTMEPYGKFLYHLTICTHFWLGPIKCISYMYTSGAYYYMEGVVIHDGIPYKDLMREDDPLNRFFAPIIALFIVLTPRLYQMYTYKQRYNRACEKSRN